MLNYEVFNNTRYKDNRGWAQEGFNFTKIESQLLPQDFKVVASFCSYSQQNVIRGLHYQLEPHNQTKVFTCIYGQICVFVLNRETKQFQTEIIKDGDKTIVVGNHCAFGFRVISDEAIVYYVFDKPQHKESERVESIFKYIDYNQGYILSDRDRV